MIIIGKDIIDDYKKKHATARGRLDNWYTTCENTTFNSPNDFKKVFGANFDFMKGYEKHYIFDIQANHYRLIVVIEFQLETIIVKWIGTHAEYSKNEHLRKL